MLKKAIEKLLKRENLDAAMCHEAATALLDPQTNPLQIAAFLVLLRAKSETPEELTAILSVLRQKMIPVKTREKALDLVGTGGDGAHTVNISTGSAILAASCGVKIAKHGNRAVSSLTGTADVLEKLGVKIDMMAEEVGNCIDTVGIGFCIFGNFHPTALPLRQLGRQLKVPSMLNFIGTLLNPANVSHYLVGVFDENLLSVVAGVLQKSEAKKSIVAHGNSLDEISCIGPTKIMEVTHTSIKDGIIDPADYGLPYCTLEDLRGGDPVTNAKLLIETLSGSKTQKHIGIANTFILNAAVALYLYGVHPSIDKGIPHARENLYSGAALNVLKKWKEFRYVT